MQTAHSKKIIRVFFDTPNRVRAISHGEWHQIKHLAPSSPISIASLSPLPESGEKNLCFCCMGIILDLHASDGAKKEKKERGKRRVGPLFYQRWEGADGSVRPSACNIAHWAEKGGALLYFRNGSGREIVKSSENYYGQHMFSNVFSFRISFLPLSSASISMLDLLSILLSECVSSPCC